VTLWAYPMDATGCGSYRVRWPLEALAEHRGLDVHIVPPGSDEGLGARLDCWGKVSSIRVPEGCTGLYIQRPTSELLIETLTALKRATDIPIICDVDDDLSNLSPRHPAFHHLHPRSRGRMPGHSAQAVHAACKLADVVTCSTPALVERYARHGRGVVLENRLPRHLVPATPPLHPGPSSTAGAVGGRDAPPHTEPRVGPPSIQSPLRQSPLGTPRVGWPGSIITHPDDLAPVLTALHRLNVPLVTLGPDPRLPFPSGHPGDPTRRMPYPDMTFTGSVDFDDWIPAIQSNMDIGIAPLAPTTFNAAKSWLKPLELAAALTPAVISDTEEYRNLDSPHLLAARPKDWHRQLRALRDDPDLYQDIRTRLYDTATLNTYDNPRVLDAWSEVFAPWCPAPAPAPVTLSV
jgi:hypothetical protein